MGIYRRPDSPTWWMSLQVNGQRVRLNTMVEDRQLADDLFTAWKASIARTRWLGAPSPDGDHTFAELMMQYLNMVIIPREQTKTKKLPLTIPLTTRAADIVHRYLESARSEYLFVSQAGHAYTCAEVNRALQRAAVKAGLRDICLYTCVTPSSVGSFRLESRCRRSPP